MKKNKKFHHAGRMVSLLLALCMILCMAPITALADDVSGNNPTQPITSVSTWLIGMETPIAGTYYENQTTVSSFEDEHYACTARWWQEGSATEIKSFTAGTSYVLKVTFTAKAGNTFADDCTATIVSMSSSGRETCTNGVYNSASNSMTYTMKPVTAVAATGITEVSADTKFTLPPVAGSVPASVNATVPSDANYTCTTEWWDYAGGTTVSSTTLVKGKRYIIEYIFKIAEGSDATFSDNCTATIDGKFKSDGTVSHDGKRVLFVSDPYDVAETSPDPSDPPVDPDDPQQTTNLTLDIGGVTYSGIVGNQAIIVSDLNKLEDITVLKQNGVDIKGMSEQWDMSTTFLDSQGRGVLEVQVSEQGDDYVTFNLQSHYADCPGAAVKDFQVMLITAVTLPDEGIKIIEGQNGKWTKGTKGALTFKANGPFDFIKSVSVDNSIIDSKNYTAKRGSTIVTLTPEYLETLSAGKHTLRINYGGHQLIDGKQAATEFEVIQNVTPAVTTTADGTTVTLNKDGAYVDKNGKPAVNSVIKEPTGVMHITDNAGHVVKNRIATAADGKKYYATKTGVIATNKIVTASGKKYYATKTGVIATKKIVTANGKKYYATKTGVIATKKIVTASGKKYYATKTGAIATKKIVTAGGKKYYATKTGAIATNKWVKVGKKKYYCNKKGVITKTKKLK